MLLDRCWSHIQDLRKRLDESSGFVGPFSNLFKMLEVRYCESFKHFSEHDLVFSCIVCSILVSQKMTIIVFGSHGNVLYVQKQCTWWVFEFSNLQQITPKVINLEGSKMIQLSFWANLLTVLTVECPPKTHPPDFKHVFCRFLRFLKGNLSFSAMVLWGLAFLFWPLRPMLCWGVLRIPLKCVRFAKFPWHDFLIDIDRISMTFEILFKQFSSFPGACLFQNW